MRIRNNGNDESNILQNQFTRYLKTAIERKKIDVLRERIKLYSHEQYDDSWREVSSLATEDEYFKFSIQFESNALEQALLQIEKRDRYIFYAHVVDERSFAELALELGVGYKGVAAAYYRVIKKIHKKMRGEKDGI